VARVTKQIQYTVTLDGNGEATINGEIPAAWTDYLGTLGTMNTADGWVTSVRRVGTENKLTVRCRKWAGGAVVPATGQVAFTLELIGTD
jgi:hypothetical protein